MGFITNKTLAPAHVPARRRRDRRAAAARVDAARGRLRRARGPAVADAVRRHLRAARRGARLLGSERRAQLRAAVHLQAAREGSQPSRDHERALGEVVRESARCDGRRSLRRRGVPLRHEAAQDDRRRHRVRHHPRSSDRAADRSGDAAAVAAARGGRPWREREQLRRRLQLRLHELDFLGDAVRALPMQVNPQVVFERLFGDGGTAEERTARRVQQRSILDSVTGSLASLEGKLGASDRVRIDQYLEDVREIERRLQIATKASTDAPRLRCRMACRNRSTSTSSCSSTCSRSRFRATSAASARCSMRVTSRAACIPTAAPTSASTAAHTTRRTRAAWLSTRV